MVRSAWEEVERSWPEDAAHRKFLALCETLGCLEEAGRRYREVREAEDGREEDAQRRIEQLIARAMTRIQTTRKEPDPRPRRITVILGIVLTLMLLTFAASFFVR